MAVLIGAIIIIYGLHYFWPFIGRNLKHHAEDGALLIGTGVAGLFFTILYLVHPYLLATVILFILVFITSLSFGVFAG